MEAWHVLVLVAANIPVYIGLGRVIFGSWEEFGEAIKFWLTPDIVSILQGKFVEDVWSELKLLYFVVLCAIVVFVEYTIIERLFFA
jgi:hypothetical protein